MIAKSVRRRPISDAIRGSARALPPQPVGPSREAPASQCAGISAPNRIDLESALVDASMLGELAYLAFCQIGFENAEPPKLSKQENALIYWTVSQLSASIDQAKAAFYGEDASS